MLLNSTLFSYYLLSPKPKAIPRALHIDANVIVVERVCERAYATSTIAGEAGHLLLTSRYARERLNYERRMRSEAHHFRRMSTATSTTSGAY